MLSDSDLHLWLKVSPLPLSQNCISWSDLWTAINFASNEYRMDKMGPSLIESEVGVTTGSKGKVFQQKTYIEQKRKKHHSDQIGMEDLKNWKHWSTNIILPDLMLGKAAAYCHHHKINPLIQLHCILGADMEYKHVKEHQTHSKQY